MEWKAYSPKVTNWNVLHHVMLWCTRAHRIRAARKMKPVSVRIKGRFKEAPLRVLVST